MPVKHSKKILRNARCKFMLSWCWCSSAVLALLTLTLPEGTRLDGTVREGNLPYGWEGLTGTRPQLDVTPQINSYSPSTFNCTFNFS